MGVERIDLEDGDARTQELEIVCVYMVGKCINMCTLE